MTPRRFAWALRSRGPALADWPLAERAAAVCLLRRNPAAREMLAEALADEDAPASDAAALSRITCPVQRALAPLTPLMRGLRWGAIAACLAAGLYLGLAPVDADAVTDLFPSLHPSTPATVLAALDQ
jgi:hypothetical protein